MASFNKVILLGNLTRDVQLKNLPSGSMVAEFGLAVNRKYKSADGQDREDVVFVDVAAFGKIAEVIARFFAKGKPILIEGRLKYDTWDDILGGGRRSKLTVVAETFSFIGDSGGGNAKGPASQEQQVPVGESDIPF